MKLLVIFAGLLSTTLAVPVENDYYAPTAAAPVVVATPVASPVVEPAFIRSIISRAPVVPLSPAPVRVLSQPIPFAPAPVATPLAAAPVPVAAPFAAAPVRVATPLAAAPVRVATPLAAAPVPVAAPLAAAPVPVATPLAAAPVPVAAPVSVSSQFHAQDELGGFNFGYQNGNSARTEVRTPNGVTRGSYSYIDANGVVQQVDYIADPINGFRVAGTNIPVHDGVAPTAPVVPDVPALVAVVDTPEVAEAKAIFQKAFDEAVARNAAAEEEEVVDVQRKKRSTERTYGAPVGRVIVAAPSPAVFTSAPRLVGTITTHSVAPIAPFIPGPARALSAGLPIPAPAVIPAPAATPLAAAPAPLVATPLAAAAPAPLVPTPLAATAPLVAAAPVVPTPLAAAPASQFHAQDEAGAVSFGYQNEHSTRQEVRRPDGVTTGSYSYVDANGVPQTVNYIADALGFRVQASNLPVAPVAPAVPLAVVA